MDHGSRISKFPCLEQRALLEHSGSCLEVVPRLWNALCENTPLQPLLMAGCPWFGPWIHLISGPATTPLDPGTLIGANKATEYLGGRYDFFQCCGSGSVFWLDPDPKPDLFWLCLTNTYKIELSYISVHCFLCI